MPDPIGVGFVERVTDPLVILMFNIICALAATVVRLLTRIWAMQDREAAAFDRATEVMAQQAEVNKRIVEQNDRLIQTLQRGKVS